MSCVYLCWNESVTWKMEGNIRVRFKCKVITSRKWLTILVWKRTNAARRMLKMDVPKEDSPVRV